MYTPPENLIYHLWERNYRPTFAGDNKGDKEIGTRHQECIKILRETVMSDTAFVQEMKERRGVDLVEKKVSAFAECGGLDSTFFS